MSLSSSSSLLLLWAKTTTTTRRHVVLHAAKRRPRAFGSMGLSGFVDGRRRQGRRGDWGSCYCRWKSTVADSTAPGACSRTTWTDNHDDISGDDGYLIVPKDDDDKEKETTREDDSYLVHAYMDAVQQGEIESDVHQIAALQELDRLRNEILSREKKQEEPKPTSSSSSSFLWQGWFGNSSTTSSSSSSASSVRGVYLHGGVGSGKTFCMDLFYESLASLPEYSEKVQKVHFHSFMLQDVHKELFQARSHKKGKDDNEDAIWSHVIRQIVKRGWILCLDEFQVTDVADALLLQTLFQKLWKEGVVLVATSNRPPQDLYLNGLQRELFLPFIDLLEEQTRVVSMWESEVDYRAVQGQRDGGVAPNLFFFGEGSAKAQFLRLFSKSTSSFSVGPVELPVSIQHAQREDGAAADEEEAPPPAGRVLSLRRASLEAGMALVTFAELCQEARGAADYLCLGHYFDTLFVKNLPRGLTATKHVNVVRRFITFVDAMYECRVRLVFYSLAENPRNVFADLDLSNQYVEEAFAFDRTRSRLEEMISHSWIQRKWKGRRRQRRNDNSSDDADNDNDNDNGGGASKGVPLEMQDV